MQALPMKFNPCTVPQEKNVNRLLGYQQADHNPNPILFPLWMVIESNTSDVEISKTFMFSLFIWHTHMHPISTISYL